MEALLAKGADLNKQGEDALTPLCVAVKNGHESIVEALLAKGADPNVTSYWKHDRYDVFVGGAPLHLAASNGPSAVTLVQKLLAHKADPNAREAGDFWDARETVYRRHKNTPLHIAAEKDESAFVVQALLAGGAEPSARNNSLRTPLHVAAWSKNVKVVKALLAERAELSARDKNGRSPIDEVHSSDAEIAAMFVTTLEKDTSEAVAAIAEKTAAARAAATAAAASAVAVATAAAEEEMLRAKAAQAATALPGWPWNVDRVCKFVHDECSLEAAAPAFKTNGVDGYLLLELTDADLTGEDLRMTALQARKLRREINWALARDERSALSDLRA